MINDVNNLLLRERGVVTKAIHQQFYVMLCCTNVKFGFHRNHPHNMYTTVSAEIQCS